MWTERNILEILEDACSALTVGDVAECHRLIHEARMTYAQESTRITKALCLSTEPLL